MPRSVTRFAAQQNREPLYGPAGGALVKFQFDAKGRTVVFSRSAFSGRMSVTVDGEEVVTKLPLEFSTHIDYSLSKQYGFQAGSAQCRIEHDRRRLFGGFRRQTYRAYVDDQLVAERYGY